MSYQRGTTSAAQLLALGVLALFALATLVPWNPQLPASDLDLSWIMVLHDAFAAHTDFGRDLIFTFGPWGILYDGFSPATEGWVIVETCFLALAFVAGAWEVCRDSSWRLWQRLALCLCLTWLVAATVTQARDVWFFSLSWMLLLIYFRREDRPGSWITVLLLVASALTGLIKFSNLLLAGIIVGVICLNEVWRKRRMPWHGVIYLVALTAWWLLARQPIASLPAWFYNSLQIAGGYTSAMSLSKSNEWIDVLWFGLTSIVLMSAAARLQGSRLGKGRWLSVAGLAVALFIAFKAGFVRNDAHEVNAVVALPVLALLIGMQKWRRVTSRFVRGAIVATLGSGLLLASRGFIDNPRGSLGTHLAGALVSIPEGCSSAVQLLAGDSPLPREYRAMLEQIRSAAPLPPMRSTVDVYPWDEAALIAHGFARHTRPVPGSYSAYTSYLADRNAAFLDGPGAPQQILFDLGTIDDRYPALDDGLSWPRLWGRYQVEDVRGPFVILGRRPQPRGFSLRMLRSQKVRFYDEIVTPGKDRLLWAEARIRPTCLGRIAAVCYKLPQVEMHVALMSGDEETYRIIPAMAERGFLLSPRIGDRRQWAAVASGAQRRELHNAQVTRFSFATPQRSLADWFYERWITISLYALEPAGGPRGEAATP